MCSDHVSKQLSTGEKQRTALTRVPPGNPSVIMADEPAGNLDDDSANIVLNYREKYVEEGGSILSATHSARAAEYAARILNMWGGAIC